MLTKRWIWSTLTAASLLGTGSVWVGAQDAPKAEEKKAEEKPAEEKKEEPKPEAKAEDKKPEEKKPEEKKPEEKPAEPAKPEEKKPDAPAAAAAAGEIKPSVEVIHLDNPSGVAVQASTGHVFITSHQGVFRYPPVKTGRKIWLEVEGFPTDIYGKGPMYNVGPLGVTMWGNDRIIVCDGSRKDGEELVRIYKVEDKAPAAPRKEADAEFTLGPIAPGDLSPKGEGNFYAAAIFNDAIFVTSNGDDTKGWVAKSALVDGKPGPLTPTIATKEATQVDAPEGITTKPDGSELVIGQGGEVNVAGDSLLTFYDKEGKLVKSYKTGLHDIVGLAYSPSGKLYAVDFAWADTTQGGLFEMVIEGEECKPKKILSLDRPTALSFDKEGGLFITVFGTGEKQPEPKEGETPKPAGALLHVAPGL
ncbi:hypothetical protein [Planctellipticum variicoloris]|uniref:hypothetical protein n=1 Tax=Planctellipticum variicoloris TaxID=3064265 RepID=UPI00301376A4|nr:hypothetical protein SH412_001497 [Planctomycetaceae bacterium SH412]